MTIRDISEFPFTLAAGARLNIHASGRYIRHVSGDAVKLSTESGSFVTFVAGREYKVAPGDPDFRMVRLHNDSASAVSGLLVIGFGDVTDNNVVIQGTTSVLETRPGTQFIGATYANNSPSNYSQVQMLNPAGSGVEVQIDAIDLSIEIPGGAGFTWTGWTINGHDTAVGSVSSSPKAKRFAASMPSAGLQLRYLTDATLYGTLFWTAAVDDTRRPIQLAFPDPIILEAGKGIIIRPSTTNVSMHLGAHWREIS